MLTMFCLLLFGHYLGDYPWQGPFLAVAKNHNNPVDGTPPSQAMVAHCVIQGGITGVIIGHNVGSPTIGLYFGMFEAIIHYYIDVSRCNKKLSYHNDQFCHIACKIAYVIALSFFGLNPFVL